jgi:hypothetical protein
MADGTGQQNVFRFIAIRPADGAKAIGAGKVVVGAPPTTTQLQTALRDTAAQHGDPGPIARDYLAKHSTVTRTEDAGVTAALDTWARTNADVQMSALHSDQLTNAGLDSVTLERLLADSSDYLFASVVAGATSSVDVTGVVKSADAALKIVNNKPPVRTDISLADYLNAAAVILPEYVSPGKGVVAPPKQPSSSKRIRDQNSKRLDVLEAAHKELTRLGSDEKYRHQPPPDPQQLPPMLDDKHGATGQAFFFSGRASRFDSNFIVDQKFIDTATPSTLSIIEENGVAKDDVSPPKLLPGIEREIFQIRTDLEDTVVSLGDAMVLRSPLTPCMYQAGVGDLLIVRQTLKAYELTEIAHVENVLAGEFRERVHRSLTVREETTTVTTEKETDKERDLQSTERNEMQSEAENTVKEDLKLDAGLQVSGSYGPSITFSSNVTASYARSTEDVQRRAVTFSREIVDRTAEKVIEKVTTQRITRLREEAEETNTHRIDNTGAGHGHQRGVYRWLNRVYDAQIFNYGKRMMYEFIVPEPAAFYLYAMFTQPDPTSDLQKPEPPLGPDGPLRPTDITEYNYGRYIAQYQVTNAPSPPARRITKSWTDKQEGDTAANFSRATTISIPDGYIANAARITYYFDGVPDRTGLRLSVGLGGIERMFSFVPPVTSRMDPAGYVRLADGYERELSILLSSHNVQSFAVSVDVFCELTLEGTAKWQQPVYEAIVQAYQNQLAAYEDAVKARSVQQAGMVQGQDPLLNRRVERDELKRLCILMLRNDANLNFDAYLDSDQAEPIIDLDQACAQGSVIRFLENAMEWNNMMYVLYSYFWGRHSRWVSALHLTDPDPDFEAFLKAGAARVQVPVRHGFEKAVAYFCQHGVPWMGGDPPVRNDSLYLPIIQEISEDLGRPGDEAPYPEGSQPWEVVLPTSLVVLQNLEEVPHIKDVLTGHDIALLPH